MTIVKPKNLAIAGGGQLAQMMIPAARSLEMSIKVLDPDAACSSAGLVDEVVVGAFNDVDALRALARNADVITFEIEKIDTEVLSALASEGATIRPSPAVLAVIQDKLAQKDFYSRYGIPTSNYHEFTTLDDISFDLPYVWKSRRDGYDGRGVRVISNESDWQGLASIPALIEAMVPIDYELATLIARGVNGEIAEYPVTEIVMDPHAHVMDSVIAPASAPPAVEQQCREIARALVEAFDYVGLLAIEFFVDSNGDVLVNEVSPRPHNSGHYTIEACKTSQFEQHLRAVCGLPLGSTEQIAAALTFNVLGAPDALGKPRYIGFADNDHPPGVYVHNYDKPEVRPGRKMAHATVVGADRETVIKLAQQVRGNIRVEAQA